MVAPSEGLTGPIGCSTFVLMRVETLGVARSLGWKVHVRCANGLSREHQIHAPLRVSQATQGSFRSKTHRLFFVVMLTGEESMWLPRPFAWC
jgi:hypothetical protein